MTDRQRLIIFLLASFVSAVGDTLMVFAVPVGLGLETKDFSATVMMWMIPAIAVFLSSFLHKHISSNEGSARRNYAMIVLFVATLEIIVSLITLHPSANSHIKLLICVFIFGYAFIKEGIPRLLYVVSVYNYFGDPKDYSKIAGISSALNILAALVGTLAAAAIIAQGSWKFALIIDAVTFLIMGMALLVAGKDPVKTSAVTDAVADEPRAHLDLPKASYFRWILLSVTLLPIANSLVWNYLPLLGEKYSITTVSYGLGLIAVFRLPGMLAGLRLTVINNWISFERLIQVIPISNLIVSILFIASPSVVTFSLLVLVQGFVAGVYWPSDYSKRNELPHVQLVRFNTVALRRLAIFQLLSCLVAVILFRSNADLAVFVPIAIVGLSLISLISLALHEGQRIGNRKGLAALAAIALIGGTGWGYSRMASPSLHQTTIVLPSISKDMRLRGDLTFSSFAVLNDVEAHFFKIGDDLTLQSDAVKNYERINKGQRYVFELDPQYRSFRGETITTSDVEFTLKHYLRNLKELSGALTSIKGAQACTKASCKLEGFTRISDLSFALELEREDFKFTEKLSSPWLILLKEGMPLEEKVGACVLPYQLGRANVTACVDRAITVSFVNKEILVTEDTESPPNKDALRIVNDNPGLSASPTLTVLTLFANPKSTSISPKLRRQVSDLIRMNAEEISTALKLRWSPLLTAKWLAVPTPDDLAHVTIKDAFVCGKKPIQILLDTSLPNLDLLKSLLNKSIPCPIEYSVTTADKYFERFETCDFGIAWFSPDYLDLYNQFSAFDCNVSGFCYFDWKDKELQNAIDSLRFSSQLGRVDKDQALTIERILMKKGYAAPFAEMNWWIKTQSGYRAIHPAGLGQISVSDFL